MWCSIRQGVPACQLFGLSSRVTARCHQPLSASLRPNKMFTCKIWSDTMRRTDLSSLFGNQPTTAPLSFNTGQVEKNCLNPPVRHSVGHFVNCCTSQRQWVYSARRAHPSDSSLSRRLKKAVPSETRLQHEVKQYGDGTWRPSEHVLGVCKRHFGACPTSSRSSE